MLLLQKFMKLNYSCISRVFFGLLLLIYLYIVQEKTREIQIFSRNLTYFTHCAFGLWWNLLFGKGMFEYMPEFERSWRQHWPIENHANEFGGRLRRIFHSRKIRLVCKTTFLCILESVLKTGAWSFLLIFSFLKKNSLTNIYIYINFFFKFWFLVRITGGDILFKQHFFKLYNFKIAACTLLNYNFLIVLI